MGTTKTVKLEVRTRDNAPEASRPVLEHTAGMYGFVPNLHGVLANSPAALHAYASLNKILGEHSQLTPAEQQAAILAISVENGCTYCVAAHSMVAQRAGLSPGAIESLRDGRDLDDAKLEALTAFAREVVEKRGRVEDRALEALATAGYEPAIALEVVALVALKTLSNYTNHLAATPLDGAFAGCRWHG